MKLELLTLMSLTLIALPGVANASGNFPGSEDCKDIVSKLASKNHGMRFTPEATIMRKLTREFFNRWLNVTVEGLDAVKAKGTSGILFLPNHPTMVGPPIELSSDLGETFRPRPLIAEEQLNNFPGLSLMAKYTDGFGVPDMGKKGELGKAQSEELIKRVVERLKLGENILMYPAGTLTHGPNEFIGSKEGVEQIVKAFPGVRIVLVNELGFKGSMTGFAGTGQSPDFKKLLTGPRMSALFRSVKRRDVKLKVFEPADFPKNGTRMEINNYLTAFYNQDTEPNIYVPLDKNQPNEVLPQPFDPRELAKQGKSNTVNSAVTPEMAQHVIDIVKSKAAGIDVTPDTELDAIGISSLDMVNLQLEIEEKLGVKVAEFDGNSAPTVRDLINSIQVADAQQAAPEVDKAAITRRKNMDLRWFIGAKSTKEITIPEGETIPEVFIKKAKEMPDKVILADDKEAYTYRDVMLRVKLLAPMIAKMPGENIGLMLPASPGATIMLLATMFAGKMPVQVNYLNGAANLTEVMKYADVQKIITSSEFTSKLSALEKASATPVAPENSFASLNSLYMNAEDMRKEITPFQEKLAFAATRITTFWKAPRKLSPFAVMLFTNGTTGMPKGVPLTHLNQLTNVRDAVPLMNLTESDRIVSFLPPCHSFGDTATQVLPLVAGVPTYYYPNPKDMKSIADITELTQGTIMIGTPSVLNGIFRSARPKQLASLQVAMIGGEKPEAAVFDNLRKKNPNMAIVEGYGTTEASPIVAVNPLNRIKIGTVGQPLKSVDAIIVEPGTLKPIPNYQPGQKGILLVRGPSIFNGYYKQTAEQNPFVEIDESEFTNTGLTATIDESGHIMLFGRPKFPGSQVGQPQVASQFDAGGPIATGWSKIKEFIASRLKQAAAKRRYYNTEDMFSRDADDNLTAWGRIKRAIKKGGEYVNPEELEAALAGLYPSTDGQATVVVEAAGDNANLILFTRIPTDLSTVSAQMKSLGFTGMKQINEVRLVDKIPMVGIKTDWKFFRKMLIQEKENGKGT